MVKSEINIMTWIDQIVNCKRMNIVSNFIQKYAFWVYLLQTTVTMTLPFATMMWIYDKQTPFIYTIFLCFVLNRMCNFITKDEVQLKNIKASIQIS